MITLQDYYMGRDVAYPDEMTDAIRAAAQVIVNRANILLTLFYERNPSTLRRRVRSGWRPAAVNLRTPGAAPASKHLSGEAIDIEDDDGTLALWCADRGDILESFEVWMERPEATPSWCHWQSVPPKSGARYFWPSQAAYAEFVASGNSPMVAA